MGCNNSTPANGKVDGQQQQPPTAEPLAKGKEEQQELPKAEPPAKAKEEQDAITAMTPSDMSTDFKIKVERATDSEKLGMVLTYPENNVLYVKKIHEEGSIPTYNSVNVNTPEVLVREGDSIVEVNGVSGDTFKMMEELGTKTKLVLAVQRGKVTNDAAPPLDTATAPVTEQVEPEVESNPKVEISAPVEIEAAKTSKDATASTAAPANTPAETAPVEEPVVNSGDAAPLDATSTSGPVSPKVDETEIAVAPQAGEMEEPLQDKKPCGGWCF